MTDSPGANINKRSSAGQINTASGRDVCASSLNTRSQNPSCPAMPFVQLSLGFTAPSTGASAPHAAPRLTFPRTGSLGFWIFLPSEGFLSASRSLRSEGTSSYHMVFIPGRGLIYPGHIKPGAHPLNIPTPAPPPLLPVAPEWRARVSLSGMRCCGSSPLEPLEVLVWWPVACCGPRALKRLHCCLLPF